mgnify:CR=1 FL=1
MSQDYPSDQNQPKDQPQPPGAGQPRQQQAGPSAPPPPGHYAPPAYYPPYSPPPRDRRRFLIPAALMIGCLPWLILFVIAIAGIVGTAGGKVTGDHVALIRVSGVITGGRSESGLFGGSVSGSEDIVTQLVKARRDRAAKVVLIRINSPGGSPAGSEEVWNEIRRVRDAGKKVYVSMGDVAASGGYYIACAADRIYADDSTITGSIGVIFSTADLSGLYRKIGINPETIKSGKFKDLGSPDRPLTPEERQILQGIVDSTFARFVKAVADGRNMPVEEVRKLADGRVFTGAQALKHKLVDEIGGLRDATLAASKAAGIRGEPKVVEYGKRTLLDTVLGMESERAVRGVEDAARRQLLDRLLRSPEDTQHGLR